MKLHKFVGSPSARKVEAVIAHLGLAVEIVDHDFRAGALRAPDYLALNANAKVPTLVDGDFTLWESNAIMQYLADQAGGDALFPRAPRARAEVVRWQFWEQAHFNCAFGTLAFETVAKPKLALGPTDAALVARAQADLARFAPVLERHLAGRTTLVGDAITIADYAMSPFEPYQHAIPFDWQPYPRITAYFERMRRHEPWARTAPAGQAAQAA
jgi:glutathione S-transferase